VRLYGFLLSTAVHTTKPAETPYIFFVRVSNMQIPFQIGTQVRGHLFSFLRAHMGCGVQSSAVLRLIQTFFLSAPRWVLFLVSKMTFNFQIRAVRVHF
jgi:hypothetical protein